jgi:hypothetical protein
MQHLWQLQQLARATGKLVPADITFYVSPASCASERVQVPLHLPRTIIARCATTAQLRKRYARTMQPDSTPVARRPSLYRDESPDDRRHRWFDVLTYTGAATLLYDRDARLERVGPDCPPLCTRPKAWVCQPHWFAARPSFLRVAPHESDFVYTDLQRRSCSLPGSLARRTDRPRLPK